MKNGNKRGTLGAAVGMMALLALAPAVAAQDSSAVRQDTATDTVAPASATSRINQRARQDSLGRQGQNPPGYRGMERPATLDSASAQAGDSGKARTAHKSQTRRRHLKSSTKQQASSDTAAGRDSTKWGYKVDRNPRHQNPPGYRGMERPVQGDSGAVRDSTGQNGQDSTSANQRQ
jgi:hypothetical protein